MATVSKNDAKFRAFDPLYNLGEGWAKCLSTFHEFGLWSNLRYTFDGASLGRLEDLEHGCQKGQTKYVSPSNYRRANLNRRTLRSSKMCPFYRTVIVKSPESGTHGL